MIQEVEEKVAKTKEDNAKVIKSINEQNQILFQRFEAQKEKQIQDLQKEIDDFTKNKYEQRDCRLEYEKKLDKRDSTIQGYVEDINNLKDDLKGKKEAI